MLIRLLPLLGLCLACTAPMKSPMKSPMKPQMTSRHHRLDYCEWTVSDLEEAQRFYGAAFGWTFNDYGPDYAGIRKPPGEEGEVGGIRPGEVIPGGPLLILYSEDLGASLEAVVAAGGTITVDPFAFPGGRRFQFSDPSGNELAVWSDVLE